MYKFFCPAANILGREAVIDNKGEVKHISKVLRLKINDMVEIFDQAGNEYGCVIEKIEDKITLLIKEKRKKSEAPLKITLACAIPKKAKFDDIVDKLTQLGSARIIPLKTERVIVKLDNHKEALRLTRWRKIAQAASQQSKRSDIPVIEPPKDLEDLLTQSQDFDLKLIPTLEGRRKTLKEIFSKIQPRNILILIGPEGDFSAKEIAMALKSGFIPVTLGDLVLRVDTAAIAVISFINLYVHD